MSYSDNLCTPFELQQLLKGDNTRVLDCSWYLPSQKINSEQAFREQHIPSARFFHFDLVCDRGSDLPHMLPSSEVFSDEIVKLGIHNDDTIVVYDSAGLFSAARVWWMFRVFGHSEVRVLNGGLPEWIKFGGELSHQVNATDQPIKASGRYSCQLDQDKVFNIDTLKKNCETGEYLVLDARSHERFLGKAPEPRAGLASGHMPRSISLPFNRLLEKGKMRPVDQLQSLFSELGVTENTKLITSCGSGVTAAIITLALAESGLGMQGLYDGSWAEWASADDTTVLDIGPC